MRALVEDLLVGLIVAGCVILVLRALLPFAWRVALARAIRGRAPDRVVVWIAGQSGCDACGRPTSDRRR